MSYVGKILVLILVVMSILFMAFAGAVYLANSNWQGKYNAEVTAHNSSKQQLTAAQDELSKAKTELGAQITALKQEAEAANALAKTEGETAAADQATINNLQRDLASMTGLAESKAAEAQFRQKEAEQQRVENRKVQERLDAASSENRSLKDQLFGKTSDYESLIKRYNEAIEKLAFLEKVVSAYKLPTDPREVERLQAPPPPVDGVVKEVRMNRANRVQFVNLTIGSDDGLVVGHQLDVIRQPPGGNGDAKYLGTVRIVSIEPDSAVAEVILAAKNGIIEEGDNVTTKL